MDSTNQTTAEKRCRRSLMIAGVLGATGVLIGAFGAHLLPNYLADLGLADEVIARRLEQFEVGARYHLVHAVAFLSLAALPIPRNRRMAAAHFLMLFGVFMFSGSLYLLVVTNTPWLGAITPIGGVAWIISWGLIATLAFDQSADCKEHS